ncbi:cell division cycle-associated protein 7-like [Impatiens glandulifera]|uniref:cell division cycle-associated protein 7-like n=1 Tax=Impatiens glandulifera TaxID=253017 RepID=UPI001FB10E86|nr:cell division cycle-associated protein 7-like [Impatiens glandulifera]
MVFLHNEAPDATLEDENSDSQDEMEESQEKEKGSNVYEKLRESRIKENQERMQNLGLFDLSLKMKSVKPTRNNNFSAHKKSPSLPFVPSTEPRRRSSRLQNSSPVSYCEIKVPKEKNLRNEIDLMRREGVRPEIYTEEHEKLLGNTEKVWTLFVDGVGHDGKKMYDSVKGKTCHQCRQKTLGLRTHCIHCELVQGQFCGDCLYMRYGEHVLEANQDPNWKCPVCRGICNCSLCRQAKGWAPTGALYRKISNLGFKSVAHYLVQTYRTQTEVEAPKTEDLAIIPFESTPETEDNNVINRKQEMKDQSPLMIEYVLKTDGVEFEAGEGILDDNNLGVVLPAAATATAGKKAKKKRALDNNGINRKQQMKEQSPIIVDYVLKTDDAEFETGEGILDDNNLVVALTAAAAATASAGKRAKKKRPLDLECSSIGSRLKLRRRGAVLGC